MGKTGEQIFKMASALIYENVNADAESKAFTVDFLNILLQECLPAENSIRRSLGETELTEAPWIESLETTIEYHDAITRTALPYGCASKYYFEAMNEARGYELKGDYKDALSNASVCTEVAITDVWETEA